MDYFISVLISFIPPLSTNSAQCLTVLLVLVLCNTGNAFCWRGSLTISNLVQVIGGHSFWVSSPSPESNGIFHIFPHVTSAACQGLLLLWEIRAVWLWPTKIREILTLAVSESDPVSEEWWGHKYEWKPWGSSLSLPEWVLTTWTVVTIALSTFWLALGTLPLGNLNENLFSRVK